MKIIIKDLEKTDIELERIGIDSLLKSLRIRTIQHGEPICMVVDHAQLLTAIRALYND
ncbi:MAG: hypothetical protein KAS32_08650 [Candidatus Peribacteraceae bacterium]|nr:hypothetical protein [Candidatus Peribacteraceae bacterium]